MRFLKILPVILLALVGLRASAQADSSLSFSLLEAQNYAIENFFLSKNAELEIESAQKTIWETTTRGLPQVSANGEFQYYLDNDIPSMSFPNFDDQGNVIGMDEIAIFQKQNFSYGASVSQLIFSGDYIVALQASKVYKLLSTESYEKVKIDLRETVSGTYFTILILRENKRVVTETIKNQYLNLEHSRKTFEVGLMEETDVDQIELTLKRTENNLRSIDNQLETMNRMLKYQLGIDSKEFLVLTDSLPTLLTQNIIDQSGYNFSLEDHIEYKMLQTQENLQELNVNLEKSLLLPNISGFYNYMGVTNATAFTPPQHLVGLRAGWTIFQSGGRSAKISKAKIQLEQAQNAISQESQRLILTAQQAQFDYETALANYYNEEINFKLSERVFLKTTASFKEGFVSSLDLSIINSQYLQSQYTFAVAIQDLLTSKVALDKAFSKL